MALPRAITRFNKHATNKVLRHLAGHGPFVELEHVGRRSGATYRVPLNAFVSADRTTVTCLLTYGPKVDWLRNTRAAGGGRMRTNVGTLVLGPPRMLAPGEGLARVPAPARALLRTVGVDEAVEFPVLRIEGG